MKRALEVYAVLVATALAVAWIVMPRTAGFWAFAGGLGIFTLNLLLLVAIGAGLFGRRLRPKAPEAAGRWRRIGLFTTMLVKTLAQGGGIYVAIVVLGLTPWYFAAGLGTGLVLFAAPFIVTRGKLSQATALK